jgi:hypothetical protein
MTLPLSLARAKNPLQRRSEAALQDLMPVTTAHFLGLQREKCGEFHQPV